MEDMGKSLHYVWTRCHRGYEARCHLVEDLGKNDNKRPGTLEIHFLVNGTRCVPASIAIGRRKSGRVGEQVDGDQWRFSWQQEHHLHSRAAERQQDRSS